jgi:peptidoglycan/LPS O-acetylase OafA/YrhL
MNGIRSSMRDNPSIIPFTESPSYRYIAPLDGLRGVAILLVVTAHFGFGKIVPGGFGVTVFFFISGFLITRLLIAECIQNSSVNIPHFYIRRFLRLAPALLTMLFLVSMVSLFLGLTMSGNQLLAGLTYTMNYYLIISGENSPLPIGVLWSLAVEEHYYLLYPLILAVFWRNNPKFLKYLVLACIAVLVWRTILIFFLHVSEEYTYKATDTRFDSILYGCILVVALEIPSVANWVRRSDALVPLGLAFILLLVTFAWRNAQFRETARYSLQGIALIPIFYSILYGNKLFALRRLLTTTPLIWIGRLSYSLYLWHVPALHYISLTFPETSQNTRYMLAWPLTFLAAAASYYLVERRFIKLRKNFRELATSGSVLAKGT